MATPAMFVLVVILAVLLFLLYRKNRELQEKYAPIVNARAEVQRAKAEADRLRSTAKADTERLRANTKAEMDRLRSETMAQLAEQKRQKDTLSKDYASARDLYAKLKQEVALLEENLEDISVGLYKPHYRYDSSEEYRKALEVVRDRQKGLVKSGNAAVCGQTWQVGGDKRAGERMTKQYLKLMLRAFNGECDAAIARVSWNNITKMEERIQKTYDTLNEFGTTMEMRITPEYLELKLAELRLDYETEQKKHEEQEEQRRIRDQMREEERALREAEKAKKEAEEEEERYQKALDRAKADLAKAKGESLELLQTRIQQLDAALHKAQEMKEKATSMAQLTRSGHVYVISNVGSFGENVFKVGMTRRLEPLDRIKELGDASVPFDFDVHAMIYSEDAPTLERELQDRFKDLAINLVNPRKEFFGVSMDDIASFVEQKNLSVQLTKLAEAREYRETLGLRAEAAKAARPVEAAERFPASL